MSVKMVHFDEVNNLMTQMMETPIFLPSEKRRMLNDSEQIQLDPNLIMDARHQIFRESLPMSPAKCSVLDEARRLLTDDEAKELYLKKEQEFLERELKKFEKELSKSRPQFPKTYPCSKRTFAASDDEDFWRISNRTESKVKPKNAEHLTVKHRPKSKETSEYAFESKTDEETSCIANIKVTIKDKPSFESEEKRLEILRSSFNALKENARHQRRLRETKLKIQETITNRRLQRSFQKWRTFVKEKKAIAKENQTTKEKLDEQKIDLFVNLITEKQKEIKIVKSQPKCPDSATRSVSNVETVKKKIYESPAQSRLNAQKMIIERQRTRLAEQERIIEELRLKRVQDEISRSSKDTIDVAKDTLTNCGRTTRRTLIQLMRQAGYRCLDGPRQLPEPPKFLLRMEARAEARKERIRTAEETRRKKLEEQKLQEEIARREEEQEKRRLQQETLRKAKKLREEQEQQRTKQMEKWKKLNDMADDFYRKYLLRRYIMEPFKELIETKNNYAEKADNHYKKNLLRKLFSSWRLETERQLNIKIEAATLLYNKNLMWYVFRDWKEATKEGRRLFQVAEDYSDMMLQDKYFKEWREEVFNLKKKHLEDEETARNHYEMKLKARYLKMWRKYFEIVEDIKESDRQKDKWRGIIQQVIPDFAPRQRGVVLD